MSSPLSEQTYTHLPFLHFNLTMIKLANHGPSFILLADNRQYIIIEIHLEPYHSSTGVTSHKLEPQTDGRKSLIFFSVFHSEKKNRCK